MKRFKTNNKKTASINITPLIDVVFILLIFFMIGSTFEKPVMKVALPEADSGKTSQSKNIELIVTKKGEVYIGNTIYTESKLEFFLKKLAVQNPQVTIFLSCDVDLHFKKFVRVMDIINKSGIKNAAIKHKHPKK